MKSDDPRTFKFDEKSGKVIASNGSPLYVADYVYQTSPRQPGKLSAAYEDAVRDGVKSFHLPGRTDSISIEQIQKLNEAAGEPGTYFYRHETGQLVSVGSTRRP